MEEDVGRAHAGDGGAVTGGERDKGVTRGYQGVTRGVSGSYQNVLHARDGGG